MAAYRLTEIRCDHCDEAESEWNTAAADLRRHLKEDGWQCSPARDLCPRCARKGK